MWGFTNADIATVAIAFFALGTSIYTIRRDILNRKFDMLNLSLNAIHELNRCILGTIGANIKPKARRIQNKAFLTEMKNHYELLAFLVNRNQVNFRHIAEIEKDFIISFSNKVKLETEREKYPEFYKLVNRLKHFKKKTMWQKFNTPIGFYYRG